MKALLVCVALSLSLDVAANDCHSTIEALLANHSKVAVEMFGLASGKNLPFDSGKYAMCKSIELQTDHQVKTKHFIVHVSAPVTGEIGLCLPAQCKDDDIADLIKYVAAKNIPLLSPILQNITISPFNAEFKYPAPKGSVLYKNPFNNVDDRLHWGKGTTPAVVVLCIVVATVLFSTAFVSSHLQGRAHLVDPQQREMPRLPKGLGWCEAFALCGRNGTWASLWREQPKRPTDCLNGLRVVSMFFIVVVHSFTQPMAIAGFRNLESIFKTPLSFNAQATNPLLLFLTQGNLAVDTFFFISGFLLSYVGKNRPVPAIMATVLRYCRLLPLFGFVMMLYTLVIPYLAFGPFAPRLQYDVYTHCPSTWWGQLLFINAFYPWNKTDGGCLGYAWYLGLDMFFAILGTILLNTWKRNRVLGWIVAGGLAFLSIGISLQQAAYYDMSFNLADPYSKSTGAYEANMYGRPWHRFPGFCIGLVAPWALDALERRGVQRGSQPTSPAAKAVVYTGCLIAWGILAACIFFPYTNMDGYGYHGKDCSNFQCWSRTTNRLFIAFFRPIWCLALLTLTLGCYFDYLPVLNSICGASFWTPLSSLTYGCYLIHPPIIKLLAGNAWDSYTFSPQDVISRASFNFVLAFAGAITLWCLVEKPCATMTTWLVSSKMKGKPTSVGPATQLPLGDKLLDNKPLEVITSTGEQFEPRTQSGAGGPTLANAV